MAAAAGDSVWGNVIGGFGDCTSAVLILAPLWSINAARINQSLGELSPYEYLAALFNCCIWALYAWVHDNTGPLLAINGLGMLIEAGYVVIFIKYTDEEQSKKTFMVLVVELLFAGAVAAVGFGMEIAPNTFGYVGVASGIGMYASPLITAYAAYPDRDVERMDPVISLAMLSNALCWLIYAVVMKDNFVLGPNLVGLFSAGAQLAVYIDLKRD